MEKVIQARYKRLEAFFTDNGIPLSEEAKRYLKWLSGLDNYTVEAFEKLFKDIQESKS